MKKYLFLIGLLFVGIAKAQSPFPDTAIEIVSQNGDMQLTVKITAPPKFHVINLNNAQGLSYEDLAKFKRLSDTIEIPDSSFVTIFPFSVQDHVLYVYLEGNTIKFLPKLHLDLLTYFSWLIIFLIISYHIIKSPKKGALILSIILSIVLGLIFVAVFLTIHKPAAIYKLTLYERYSRFILIWCAIGYMWLIFLIRHILIPKLNS